VYHAVVLTTLLYGCETWTLYRHSVCKLDQFHLRCFRKVAGQNPEHWSATDVRNSRHRGTHSKLAGSATSSACRTAVSLSRSSLGSWLRGNVHNAGRLEGSKTSSRATWNGAKSTRQTCAAPHSVAPAGVPCVTKQLLSLSTRVSLLSSIDEQSGSSAHNHSTTLVPGGATAAPGSATPELDSTHMNGLIDDKKWSVVPRSPRCVCVYYLGANVYTLWSISGKLDVGGRICGMLAISGWFYEVKFILPLLLKWHRQNSHVDQIYRFLEVMKMLWELWGISLCMVFLLV